MLFGDTLNGQKYSDCDLTIPSVEHIISIWNSSLSPLDVIFTVYTPGDSALTIKAFPSHSFPLHSVAYPLSIYRPASSWIVQMGINELIIGIDEHHVSGFVIGEFEGYRLVSIDHTADALATVNVLTAIIHNLTVYEVHGHITNQLYCFGIEYVKSKCTTIYLQCGAQYVMRNVKARIMRTGKSKRYTSSSWSDEGRYCGAM